MIPQKKIDKYRKVYQLAKRGSTASERSNAQKVLNNLEFEFPGISREAFPPQITQTRVKVTYNPNDSVFDAMYDFLKTMDSMNKKAEERLREDIKRQQEAENRWRAQEAERIRKQKEESQKRNNEFQINKKKSSFKRRVATALFIAAVDVASFVVNKLF